jgi:predicted transcriptional regulator YdeE
LEKTKVKLEPLNLIGFTVRTNNKNEMNPEKSKIAKLAGDYWSQQIANAFKDRVSPGITYSVYTEYESDEHGEYTYFIGERVKSLDKQDQDKFKQLVIPAGKYQKFTSNLGKLPDIVISSWQKIWQMSEKVLDGKRNYIADFELYDQRAKDVNHAVVDIFIGIK